MAAPAVAPRRFIGRTTQVTATLAAALLIGLIAQTQDSRADAALAFGQGSISSQWASGTAWNYGSSAEASETALNNCRSRGPNCRIMTTFKDTCVALAVQDRGNGYGWQIHADIATARQQALSICSKYGLSCSLKAGFCDGSAAQPTEPPPLLTPTAKAPVTPSTTGAVSACQRFPNLC